MPRVLIATLLAGAVVSAQDAMRFADEAAHDLFVRSRAAVVQTGSVQQLHSLVMKGVLRSFADNGTLLEGDIEIRALLPDHFVRIETYGTSRRISGFAGRRLLTEMRDGNRVEPPPENLTTQLLRLVHGHFTRLMLGAVTYISADQHLTFRSSGGAVAMVDPRETARNAISLTTGGYSASGSAVITNATPDRFALDVASENFSVRYIVDSVTRVPTQIVFEGAKKEPNTMKFEDRRVVSGFDLPFRITTSARDRALETIVFDEIRVNPELSRDDFRVESK